MAWYYKIKLKHLFTEKEDHASIQESMSAIAKEIRGQTDPGLRMLFVGGWLDKFDNIPEGDEYFKPVDYANKLLDQLYNIADRERVWIA